jgi:SAM-dependent MidA family methyltransferase
VLRNGRLRERYVDRQAERFVEVEGPLSDPSLAAAFYRIGIDDEGVVVEVRPAVGLWTTDVAARLKRGAAIVIDYGGEPRELFGPHHPEGTVLAYRHHRIAEDVLNGPGQQDITAHVDFADLRSLATGQGFDVLGQTSLASFLIGCGLEDHVRRAQGRPDITLPELLHLRTAVRRLLDPHFLGGFRVLVLGRGVPSEPPLRGLAAKIPTRACRSRPSGLK